MSELARQELQNVVGNLKAQESIMQRQKQLEDDMDLLINQMNKTSDKMKNNDEQITGINEKLKKEIDKNSDQDEIISNLDDKTKEYVKRFACIDAKNKEQDESILSQMDEMNYHEQRIAVCEALLSEQKDIINMLTTSLNDSITLIKQQKDELDSKINEKSSKRFMYGAYLFAVLSMVIAILSLLL